MHLRCPRCGGEFDGCDNRCPYCLEGVRFAGLGLAAKETNLPCPRCAEEARLYEVEYRGILIDVCVRCEGSWYDIGELDALVQTTREDASSGSFQPSKPPVPRNEAFEESAVNPVYIRCPHCQRIMDRRNFERRSGILVDLCLEHGVWLDGGEIQRIRAWAARSPQASSSSKKAKADTEVDIAGLAFSSMKKEPDAYDQLGEKITTILRRLFVGRR